MNDFFYQHTGTVKRSTAKTDDNGDELFDLIYDGICGLQIDSSGDTAIEGGIYQKSPTVILPAIDIIFKTGDFVSVTVENAQTFDYTVKSHRIITEEGISGTTLWLKKGTNVQ